MISSTTKRMRRVQGATYRKIFGIDVCISDDKITDFNRTTWRLFGIPVWRLDRDHEDVPMHVFINDCLGGGQ